MKSKESERNTKSSSGSSREVVVDVTDSMKRKFFLHQLIYFIYHLTRLTLTIFIIIIITPTSLTSILSLQAYDRLQQNLNLWNKDVIIDMISVSSYNCPQAYQPYSFVQWPGINQGCECKTQLNDYDYIHVLPGTCYGKLIDAGCTQVQSQSSIPFSFWESNNLICLKRIKGLNFYSNFQSQIASLKSCGKGDFEIISIKDIECPISEIKNTTGLSASLENMEFSYERQNNFPIIDLKVSQYRFCLEYNNSNISPNRFHNYNLQPAEIITCEEQDPRVIEVDQQTEKQLYEKNQRILEVVSSLPVYPEPSDDYVYKLGMVRYPPWKLSCRNSEAYSLSEAYYYISLNSLRETTDLEVSLLVVLVMVTGIVSSGISLVKHGYELKSKINSNTHYVPESELDRINPNYRSQTNYCYEVFKVILFMILEIVLIIVICVHLGTIQDVYQWYRNAKDCTDSDMILWLSEVIYKVEEMERQTLKCILMIVVVLLVDILNVIWRCHKSDLSHKENRVWDEGIREESGMGEEWSEKSKNMERVSGFERRQQTEESLQMDEGSMFGKELRVGKWKKRKMEVEYSEYD